MKIKDFFKNKNKLFKIKQFFYIYRKNLLSCLVIIIFGVIMYSFALKSEGEKIVLNSSTGENSYIVNKEDVNLLEKTFNSILNTNQLQNANVESQIRFFNKEYDENEVTFKLKELLSFSVSGNFSNENNIVNLRGFCNFSMSTIEDMHLKFPLLVNDMKNNFEVFLDIPFSYKNSFNMDEKQEYLYINKSSFDSLYQNYKTLPISNKIAIKTSPTNGLVTSLGELPYVAQKEDGKNNRNTDWLLFKKIHCLEDIQYEENGNNGLYSFTLKDIDLLVLYNLISSDSFKDSYIIKNLFPLIFNTQNGLEDITLVKGQVAINNGIATDIYFEITKSTETVIAFRILFTNINENYSVEKFNSENIKLISDFINEINEEITDDNKTNIEEDISLDTEEIVLEEDLVLDIKTIEIGDVYFTGEDETTKLEEFSKETIPNVVNVFLNFSNCSKNTNIIIKWFFEDQEIPLISTKISNGEYEKGMLKSSIMFSDREKVLIGTYSLKIYIEGIENPFGEASFTVTEKKEEIIEEDANSNEENTITIREVE